ncbi:hypothetical protein R6Z07M_008583 [Ovis aries]
MGPGSSLCARPEAGEKVHLRPRAGAGSQSLRPGRRGRKDHLDNWQPRLELKCCKAAKAMPKGVKATAAALSHEAQAAAPTCSLCSQGLRGPRHQAPRLELRCDDTPSRNVNVSDPRCGDLSEDLQAAEAKGVKPFRPQLQERRRRRQGRGAAASCAVSARGPTGPQGAEDSGGTRVTAQQTQFAHKCQCRCLFLEASTSSLGKD